MILKWKTEKCNLLIVGLELTIFRPDDAQSDKQNPKTRGYFKARYNDATVVSRIYNVGRIRDGPDAPHLASLPLCPALPSQPVLHPPPRRASSPLLHIQHPRLDKPAHLIIRSLKEFAKPCHILILVCMLFHPIL